MWSIRSSGHTRSWILTHTSLYDSRARKTRLHVQVPNLQRVRLDEIPPGLDLVSHEDGEDLVGFDVVLDLNPEEPALRGVHRGLPELRRVHLAETLVALDRQAFLRALVELVERRVQALVDRGLLALHQGEVRRGQGLQTDLIVHQRPVLAAGHQVPVDLQLAVDAVAAAREADEARAVLFVLADLDFAEPGLLDLPRNCIEPRRIGERGLVADLSTQRDPQGLRRETARNETVHVLPEDLDLLQEVGEARSRQPVARSVPPTVSPVPVNVTDFE